MRPVRRLALCLALFAAAPVSAEILSLDAPCAGGAPAAGLRVQLQDGRLDCRPAGPGGAPALWVRAGPKAGRVGKAALILPFDPVPAGGRLTMRAEFLLPEDSPRDSILLMDAECKHCGAAGNPGLRLYLRDGRLRVDRAKIGERHAWVRDDAPRLPAGQWVRIAWQLDLGPEGRSRVTMDGAEVLHDRGRTLPRVPRPSVDRLQIGVTANSNAVPVELWMRAISVEIERP